MLLPLTGAQYSEKVTENCVAYWKSVGTYTDAEARAVEKFLEVFKEETFPPGASILFTQLPNGSLAVSDFISHFNLSRSLLIRMDSFSTSDSQPLI